jgi:GTP-binding protein
MEKGKAIPYSIDKLQDRKFFVEPNAEIYEGQVIEKTLVMICV